MSNSVAPTPPRLMCGASASVMRWISGSAKSAPTGSDSTWQSCTRVATLGEVSSRSTRLRKPLLRPVDSATCASVSPCAMRVLRSFAPMGVPAASADGWMGRMAGILP